MRRASLFALFLVVFSLSLLVWSGTLHTSDGLAMYAVSDSLARYGTWDIENIRWIGLQQGTFGPDGLLYSRKGVAVSLVALPLVWAAYQLDALGPVHAATLLTPLLHALTAVYLFATVRRLLPEADARAALRVTLLWAFGSMALAYVKTWFSEPAVALATIAALYHLFAWRDARSPRSVLAVGAWLGFSLLTRSAHAIVFPFYGLALLSFALLGNRITLRTLFSPAVLRPALLFLAPILLSGLLYLWYNDLRFSNLFDSGYIEGEEFSAIWWQGLWGQTFSFGRGLFWYTPWLLLVPVGAWRWRRTEPVILFLAVGSALTYILVYAKWYLWSGGFAWGPRFLVPILPLLALMTAPVPSINARWWRAWWTLALVGFAVNLVGALYDFNLYQVWLDGQGVPLFAWESFTNPAYAQIPSLLLLGLADARHLDLAWMVSGSANPAILAALLLTVAVGCALAWWVHRRQLSPVAWLASVGVMGALLFVLLAQMHRAEQTLVRLPDALTRRAAQSALPAVARLWYDAPDSTELILNQVKGEWEITGFFVDGDTLDAPTEQRALAIAEEASAPIYLFADGPAPAQHGLHRLLAETLFPVEDVPLADGAGQPTPYTLSRFWQGGLGEPIAYNLPLTFADGATLRLESARVTESVANGGVLTVELRWRAYAPLPPTTQVFVQLAAPDGSTVAQRDGAPGQGSVDLTTLNAGQLLISRHALPVEPPTMGNGFAPGIYTLRFGLYRYDTLERATLPTGANEFILPISITE